MSDGEDDDWFESAFRDDETESEGDSPPSEDESSSGPSDEADPFDDGGSQSSADTDNPFADSDGGDSPFDDDDDGGSPFGDEGGAFEEGASGSVDDGSSTSDSPFDDGDDDGGSLFGDDFATAFESAGGGGGGGEGEFEDEDFDSDIPRIDIGIDGLDRMIQGGIPRRHLIVSIGSAGTGKTTFGLQFLHHGLENGENCVFITLEQSHGAIMDTANDRDWEFDRY